jgi:hypothetical protein
MGRQSTTRGTSFQARVGRKWLYRQGRGLKEENEPLETIQGNWREVH